MLTTSIPRQLFKEGVVRMIAVGKESGQPDK